jgi:RND family efflux transporter MFP subunit
VTDVYEAVGTVRPRTETRIEAQVTGKVVKVNASPGQRVRKGDVLVVLDSREMESLRAQAGQGLQAAQSGREQARQAVAAAKAGFDKAQAQYKRISKLFSEGVVTKSEMDQAEADYLQAKAEMERAQDGLSGAESAVRQAAKALEQTDIAVGYTEIRAPQDAQVSKRLAEPGDLAFPGKALLVLQTAGGHRLEAQVREGLIHLVRPGLEMSMMLTALDRTVRGVVEEVVPEADPRTRTFLVKVSLPDLPGLYPGMFGRLLVDVGERRTVVVPARAVRRVGQLETVDVVEDGSVRRVYVKTGRQLEAGMEILSGLEPGDVVALDGEFRG